MLGRTPPDEQSGEIRIMGAETEYTALFERQFIDGEWVPSSSADFIDVENPATFEHFARIPDGTVEDVDRAVDAARRALPSWKRTPLEERCALMELFLKHFQSMRNAVIGLEVKELGAPVTFAANAHCDYQYVRVASYIEAAGQAKLEEAFPASTVIREPVGVVGCITPWNYPLGQIVQKVVPALLMGNTVVLKPSQSTPLTACLMVEAFRRAGFPKGTINLISGRGSRAGARFAVHPKVAMISFTGSTEVGVTLAQQALAGVKRVSLELGGKSPCVWLPDVPDYAPAVPHLFNSILLNSGQTCTALSRLLVPKSRLAEVEALLVEHLSDYPVGDPADPKTKIGPVASKSQYETVKRYVELGVGEGARLLAGGVPEAPVKGWYVKPVIFTDVRNDMRIAREEIFGPVLCVIPYGTLDEAVELANDTPYGLNAMVYGASRAQACAVARRINAGNVYINDGPRDVYAPFGGYGASGIGREGGLYGLLEFTQLKALFDHSTF